jgi:hypothetical protein
MKRGKEMKVNGINGSLMALLGALALTSGCFFDDWYDDDDDSSGYESSSGSGSGGCTNSCYWSGDGECDDGGEGATYSVCEYGTDCTDCGVRPVVDDGGGSSGGGGTTGEYLLTCHDGRTGIEQCVHYTCYSQATRDSYYAQCAGLTSRTRDVHNCPAGATGNGFCRHQGEEASADTYTYNGTAAELQERCRSTGGTWY